MLSKKMLDDEYKELPMIVFGPFEAPVYKVENKYRMRMILKCRLNKRSRAMLSEIMIKFSKANVKGLLLSVDLNPSNI
jgi:primosomal protein N' (replication factor Y)